MADIFRIIKTKSFTANDTDHIMYVLSYKGRVVTASTLHFEGEAEDTLTHSGLEPGDTLTIKGGFDREEESYVDKNDVVCKAWRLLPKW